MSDMSKNFPFDVQELKKLIQLGEAAQASNNNPGPGGMDLLDQFAFEMKLKQQQAAAVAALRGGVQPKVDISASLANRKLLNMRDPVTGQSLMYGGGGESSIQSQNQPAVADNHNMMNQLLNGSSSAAYMKAVQDMVTKLRSEAEIRELLGQHKMQQHLDGIGQGPPQGMVPKGRQIVKQNSNLWNPEPSSVGGGGMGSMKMSVPPPPLVGGAGNRNSMTDVGHFGQSNSKSYRNGGDDSGERGIIF